MTSASLPQELHTSKLLRLRLDVSGFIAPWLKANIERDPAGFVAPALGSLSITKRLSVTLALDGYDDGPIIAVHGVSLPLSLEVVKLEKHIREKLDPLRPLVLFYGEWLP